MSVLEEFLPVCSPVQAATVPGTVVTAERRMTGQVGLYVCKESSLTRFAALQVLSSRMTWWAVEDFTYSHMSRDPAPTVGDGSRHGGEGMLSV